MNRLLFLAAPAALLFPACAPPECVESFDCGIGNVCRVDGTCQMNSVGSAGAGLGVRGDGAVGGDVGVGSFYEQGGVEGGAAFDGNVGPTQSQGSADLFWMLVDGTQLSLRVSLPQRPSTFVNVVFQDATVLEQPGRIVVADPADGALGETWAQACNYDEAQYDEALNDVVVDIEEPDDAGVVPVVITVDGEATRGTALVPWSPLR